MATFRLIADWETSERAGAGGMYQIESLTMDGKDVTHMVDQGMHFSGEDSNDIVKYLAGAFNIPEKDVKFEEVGAEDWPFK